MIRLLFVDDDAHIRRVFLRLFPRPNYQVEVAESGIAALDLIEQNDYDAIISDYRMPRMDGGEFLARACDRRPHAVRILVTAESDFDVAVQAVNKGEIFRIVRKPWDEDDLHFAIRLGLEIRDMRREREDIIQVLNQKTDDLARVNAELEKVNQQLEERVKERTEAIVQTIVSALDYRDDTASDRAHRIASYARRLGEALGLTESALRSVVHGALLHDIGKLGVRDAVLFKNGPLDDEEWAKMRQHPALGARMLRNIEFLTEAQRIVLHHRECWDGSGYPAGLGGEDIAIGARIFAVAEVIDSILGDPYYAGATGYVVARSEIERGSGRLFDPRVVQAFLATPSSEWIDVREEIGAPHELLEVA